MQVLLFVLPIILLIIIHEFGHFIAAKLFGIEVEEFGLGFPPRAAKLFRIRETDYTLNWLPLGGFVKIKGESDPDVSNGLQQANPWVRIAVYAAGPIANLAVAIVLLTVVFMQVGRPDLTKIQVTQVDTGSPAAEVGILPGDLIQAINGEVMDSSDKLVATIRDNVGKEVSITVDRAGEAVILQVVPRSNPPEGEGAVGFHFTNPYVPVNLFEGIAWGTSTVIDYARVILTIPGRLIQGTMAPEDARLLGYVGMYNMHEDIKDSPLPEGVGSWVNSAGFFATISISLGLLNLFPIPAVDGGRILFTLPEILFRKRIPVKYENAINFVSFSLLIVLLIYVNLQDILNPVQF